MIDTNTSLQDLFNYAVFTLTEVQKDEIFLVKDLFRGFDWNRIAKGNRTKLGAMFFAYAQEKGANDILPLGKTPQNQQMYKRL